MNFNELNKLQRNLIGILLSLGVIILPIIVGLLFKNNLFELGFLGMIIINAFFYLCGYLTKKAEVEIQPKMNYVVKKR